MTPELLLIIEVAIICFAAMCLMGAFAAFKYLVSPTNSPAVVKVQAESKDNSWTYSSAQAAATATERAATTAASAEVQAAKYNAHAAADTRAAEEARLERVRLERGLESPES